MNNQNENKHSLSSVGGEGQGEGPNSQLSTLNPQLVYAYTRSQAIADGFQVEVSKVAREAGITYPVFLTRAVYDNYVAVPAGVTGQDEAGRLWDIVWMTRFAIIRMRSPRNRPSTINHPPSTSHRLPVALYVRNSDSQPARLIKLIAVCGPLDIDDPAPAITVMMPDED
jgi:hypothetical protein